MNGWMDWMVGMMEQWMDEWKDGRLGHLKPRVGESKENSSFSSLDPVFNLLSWVLVIIRDIKLWDLSNAE